jgi:hypothetical protein
MTKQSPRRARIVGGVLTSAVLALSLLLPSVASAGGIDLGPLNVSLVKECGDAGAGDNAQGQCNYQVADPTGGNVSADVSAENKNSFDPAQFNLQKQVQIQAPDGSYNGEATVKDIEPKVSMDVKSGSVDVSGNWMKLDLSDSKQIANAGNEGDIRQEVKTGDVENKAIGDNVLFQNTSADQSSDGSISGDAKMTDSGVNANGGDSGKATGGDAASASKFGLDGGWGGSNVNVAVGKSTSSADGGEGLAANLNLSAAISAALSDDGTATADDANASATNTASAADGGTSVAGNGAQADPSQTAGAGGGAWFALSGDGGWATSGAAGAGGGGTLNNTNNVGGTTSASGTANAGSIHDTYNGHQLLGTTGGNTTAAYMVGGTAVNSTSIGMAQTGNVYGYSGDVTNNGSPSISLPININQNSNPYFCLTNDGDQASSNTANAGGMNAYSGAQTASPFEIVKTGEQNAKNLGIQDSLNPEDSFNTKTETTTIQPSNFLNGNSLLSGNTSTETAGSNSDPKNNH